MTELSFFLYSFLGAVAIVLMIIAHFVWMRHEANQARREFLKMHQESLRIIHEMHLEMKDFHKRIETIEINYRDHLLLLEKRRAGYA
jgi:hypothetical protein